MVEYLSSKDAFSGLSTREIEELIAYDDVFDILHKGARALAPTFNAVRGIVLSDKQN